MTTHEHNHQPLPESGPPQQHPGEQPAAPYVPPSHVTQQSQASTPPPPTIPPGQQPPAHYQETDILGILSIVFVVIVAPVGLVLGIVGMVQAKKKGIPNTVSLVGVILNSIFSVFWCLYVAFMIFAALLGVALG